MNEAKRRSNGKWVVLAVLIVGLIGAYIRWKYVPRSNPKETDPGSPYYSPSPKPAPDLNPPATTERKMQNEE